MGPRGHFRIDLRTEQLVRNQQFSIILTTFCVVVFLSLFECASDAHGAHFETQNGSEKWYEIRLEAQLLESSFLLLFSTLWHDFGLPK